MTLTLGKFMLEVERGGHVYVRVPRVGEMFLSLDDFKPEGKRVVFDREQNPDRAPESCGGRQVSERGSRMRRACFASRGRQDTLP
jgi:hypothetical protein